MLQIIPPRHFFGNFVLGILIKHTCIEHMYGFWLKRIISEFLAHKKHNVNNNCYVFWPEEANKHAYNGTPHTRKNSCT